MKRKVLMDFFNFHSKTYALASYILPLYQVKYRVISPFEWGTIESDCPYIELSNRQKRVIETCLEGESENYIVPITAQRYRGRFRQGVAFFSQDVEVFELGDRREWRDRFNDDEELAKAVFPLILDHKIKPVARYPIDEYPLHDNPKMFRKLLDEQLRLDEKLLKKAMKYARRPLCEGFKWGLLITRRKGNYWELFEDGDPHVHGADSHAWLPEGVVCVFIYPEAFKSYEELREELTEQLEGR